VRLFGLLGYTVKSLTTNIGLEQELFLIDRKAYLKRPDLQLTGRTVMGKMSARGQEMCDHYMAPPSTTSPALAAMKEMQQQCFKMGIPLKTRHREVAPNQYEFAPMYGSVQTQIDQNLMVMQIIEEVAVTHGLAALMHEKPFSGINGSGKHNNWSISTDDGTNLLNVKQLEKNSGSSEIFPIIMAAIVKAINDNGDLMRMSIASPGNDFRLGACEAPPSIISTYLGEDLTSYLESYIKGEDKPYTPASRMLNMGASMLPLIQVPAEDRNRTSPFPYGGHRFEFRAVGSSQNVSLVNTVLSTIVANAFKEFADAIEGGQTPKAVAQEALSASWKTIFNGNGYDLDQQKNLTEMGLWRFDSGVDAMCRFTEPKNVALFAAMKVLTPEESASRQDCMLQQYNGTVEMEVLVMLEMIEQHVIPSIKAAGVGPLDEVVKGVATLKAAFDAFHHATSDLSKALLARELRLETMVAVREVVDSAEAVVPASMWTLATYKELLFMDVNHSA
jgi:glutamine synthetase